MKGKFIRKLERILKSFKNKAKIGILLAGASIASFNSISIANNFNKGKLIIVNYVYDVNISSVAHYTMHYLEGTEGYDGYDLDYIPFLPSGKMAKIVSIIPDHELLIDTRPLESLTPVNLELSLHHLSSQPGYPIIVSNLKNELRCSFPVPYFGNFGSKPITLWERNPTDPNELYFMADVREAIVKSDFYWDGAWTAKIPLADLNGTYGSEVPYFYAQIRFDRFAVDFNSDGKINLKDFAILANDWNATDVNSVADISGPNGIPDNKVDFYDLGAFVDDYLKDSDSPNTW
jgi:hypothetical protein